MANDWEFESLEGRVEALEKENRRRSERLTRWTEIIWWGLVVAVNTAMITLAATGTLHHH
jgi:hypothetical protein